MKQQKPWYREGRGWYVCIRGKQIPLGKHPEGAPPPKRNKKGEWLPPPEITAEFHRLMAGNLDPKTVQVATICDLFLAAVPLRGRSRKAPPHVRRTAAAQGERHP